MSLIKLNTDRIVVKGSDDSTILDAPLLELYYTLAYGDITDEKLSHVEKMQRGASLLNRVYGTNLTWYQVASILDNITEELEAAKKNSTSMLESQVGMESTPSVSPPVS